MGQNMDLDRKHGFSVPLGFPSNQGEEGTLVMKIIYYMYTYITFLASSNATFQLRR